METGLGREMGCVRETADELWDGHTLLKSESQSAHRYTHTQRECTQSENSRPIRQFHFADINMLYCGIVRVIS